MKEAAVEQYLREQVERRGGVCLKIDPANNKGFPDRLILLPHSAEFLAEVKKPKGGVLSEHQKYWGERIATLGFSHAVVWTKEGVDEMMSSYDAYSLSKRKVAGHA